MTRSMNTTNQPIKKPTGVIESESIAKASDAEEYT